MITGIQIIAIFFALFMAYLTFLNYKRRDFNLSQLIIWCILWLAFILLMLMPNKFDFILNKLNIARAFDLFSILGFIFILLLTFYNYLSINRIEKKIEKTIREKTLQDIDKL